jgi:hypothetical protein
MVMMPVHKSNGAPSLAEAAGELGISVADIDQQFGVVAINPAQGLYAVQVKESSVGSADPGGEPYRGPYSNPKIAPFGPLQPAEPEKKSDGDKR